MKPAHAVAALFLACAASRGMATDWRYAIGVHDFAVHDVGSHTRGVNASASMDKYTDSGHHLFGSFDFFLEQDKDDLDTDHMPLWWHLQFGTDGDFWRRDRIHVGWTADVENRENTVSGIERQVTALPAFVAGYDGPLMRASLTGGFGYFSLELDDDAPLEQGYARSALQNNTFAWSATARLTLRLGESWAVAGRAQGWWDDHRALETRYQAALRWDASRWIGKGPMKQPALVLSADYWRYNLEVYQHPGAPPILRWNDDMMIRLSLQAKW